MGICLSISHLQGGDDYDNDNGDDNLDNDNGNGDDNNAMQVRICLSISHLQGDDDGYDNNLLVSLYAYLDMIMNIYNNDNNNYDEPPPI